MIFGIDLGSSSSCISYLINNKPEPVVGGHTIPSVVLLSKEGDFFVGLHATGHRNRYDSTNLTVRSIKRKLQRYQDIPFGPSHYPAILFYALILTELKLIAEEKLKLEVSKAVISVPANFGIVQRQAVSDAALVAGIQPLRIINEAISTALDYSHYHGRGAEHDLMVYDIGAGSLDVAAIKVGTGIIEVIGVDGDEFLGGEDFDELIVNKLIDHCMKTKGFDPLDDQLEINRSMALNRLYEAAETAKRELSDHEVVEIRIPFIRNILGHRQDLDMRLSRREFESMSESLIKKCIKPLENLNDKKLFKDKPKLLVTGGMARMPMIRNELKKWSKNNMIFREKCVVANGAAIQSGVLHGTIKDLLLLDVFPKDVRLVMSNTNTEVLISKNTTTPTKKSKIVTTTSDNQSSISVKIQEGNFSDPSKNITVTEIILDGVLRAKAGIPQIEISIEIDANQKVNASARDLGTGKLVRSKTSSPFKLSAPVLNALHRQVNDWAEVRKLGGKPGAV